MRRVYFCYKGWIWSCIIVHLHFRFWETIGRVWIQLTDVVTMLFWGWVKFWDCCRPPYASQDTSYMLGMSYKGNDLYFLAAIGAC